MIFMEVLWLMANASIVTANALRVLAAPCHNRKVNSSVSLDLKHLSYNTIRITTSMRSLQCKRSNDRDGSTKPEEWLYHRGSILKDDLRMV